MVNKSLRISKFFLKKGFKLRSNNKNGALMVAFVLGLPKANSAMKK